MEKSKGTILYVGGFELPDRNAAAHRVLNNAKIFRELGYRVVFCGVDTEITFQTPVQTFDVCGFDSIPLPYPKSSKQWLIQMFDIGRYLELLARYDDIQLVVCYNLHAVPLWKLLQYCKKHQIKIVADCTEWYENKIHIHPVKLIKCLDTVLCMRWLQKKCNGMIAISSYLEKYYKKYIKNIVVIPPLVDIRDEKFNTDKLLKSEDGPILIYSGSPSADKEALGEIVQCLQRMKDISFKFKVVGVSKEQFYQMYHIFPEMENIEFLGRVSHLEALEEVKNSDYALLIRPKIRSNMAGFPTKFAEAISCGTAVITNATSDLPKYLADFKNGYLVDESHLEQELREVLTLKEKPTVQHEIFDYRGWKEPIEKFLRLLD